MKRKLAGLTLREINELIEPEGFNLSHARSITNSLYKKRVTGILLMSGVPGRLRMYLNEVSEVGLYDPATSEVSSDLTVKYLFRNSERKLFETVYIPDNNRHTVCVSTQSGCRMGCPFCVTSEYGFHGNLDAADIINQAIGIPPAEKLTHVVFMGMGEPLDNLENVVKACEIMTAEWGMAISPRNITVSTVGITPGVSFFLERTRCNLALSLFSPFPEERIRAVPAEKKFPAGEIIGMMKNYPAGKKRRFSIAYVMIRDINDSDRHLEELKAILRGSEIRVNLLPYHQISTGDNLSSTDERMMYFKHRLVVAGISASVRKSRGRDISAACGLLASGLKPGV